MTAEQIISLAETTKEAMDTCHEAEDKAGVSALAKALASLVTAVAGQLDLEAKTTIGQFKVA